jgi:thiol-disulfide isomerase/thioredoxin
MTDAVPTRPGLWSGRRKYLVAAALLVVLAIAAVAVASGSNPSSVAGSVNVGNLPVGPTPPALTDAAGWLNSPPLSPTDLNHKVVLYDFWTYSCVNCVRTIPHLRAWYQRYAPDGLVIVGIHSPEFDFEKDHGNVTAAVQRLHVNYPVALDDSMTIWNQFGTQYWPEDWVADRQGHLRYQGIGEGNYTETENVIRKLLGVPASSPRAGAVNGGSLGQPGTQTTALTPETYLGLDKGTVGAQPGAMTYPAVTSVAPDSARLAGPWTSSGQYVQSAGAGAQIVLGARARSVNLVMAVAAGTPAVKVVVQLDGKPLPAAYRTDETQVDAAGQTFITVASSDLYRLVLAPRSESHTVRLIAQAPGVQAFAFTFGA